MIQASTSQCRIPYSESQDPFIIKRDQLLALNPPGLAEFLEVISLVSVNARVQLNLWRDYNSVQQRFEQLSDLKLYLEVMQRHARFLKLNLDQMRQGLTNLGDGDLEELILYCSWSIRRDQRKDELK
ncbi:30250_t:CDS:1, partial [Gigaspora margarita]